MAYRRKRGMGATAEEDAVKLCGWDCTGFWSFLDPCCLLLTPGNAVVAAGQTIGGALTPPAVSQIPPGPVLPPGPPANYIPSSPVQGPLGNPIQPSQEAQTLSTYSTIVGTPADPNSPFGCKWLGFGCQNGGSGSIIPSWMWWVGLGVGLLIVEGR